jgi:DNA repair protein RecO (recombination protein O)
MKAAPHQPAFVLHRYDWSESSSIVELFARDAGRIAVAAKGARRPTSNLRAVLLPFQRIHVSFSRGREEAASEIHNLRGAEWAGGVPTAGGDALLSGFYVNELVMKLLARDDPHSVLWQAYAEVLPWLGSEREPAALRAFELLLLAETGHLPDLSHTTQTQQPLQAAQGYLLRPEAGLIEARHGDDAVSGAAFAALHGACARRDFTALCAACQPVEGVLRRQLRHVLAYHLGGAPLRTREVVRDLQPLLNGR